MRVFADTSFLIPALLENHPNHARAFAWTAKMAHKDLVFGISSHSIAEVYAVLTSLPVSPRIPPGTALQMIANNLLTRFHIVALGTADYQKALQLAALKGLCGGITYDVLIYICFEKFKADRLLTFNHKDFMRICPDRQDILLVP